MVLGPPQFGKPIQIELGMGHVEQDTAGVVRQRVLLKVFRRVAQPRGVTE